MSKYRVKTSELLIENGTEVEPDEDTVGITFNAVQGKWFVNPDYLNFYSRWFEEVQEFEVGDWIWISTIENIYLIRLTNTSGIRYKGFGFRNEEWYGNTSQGLFKDDSRYSYRKATKEEIEEALIKEAKRRGYKEGVKIKDADEDLPYKGQSGIISDSTFIYALTDDELYIKTRNRTDKGHHYVSVYKDGNWAEIIDQTPDIKINDHEVTLKESEANVGCKTIRDEVFDALHQLNRAHDLRYYRRGEDITDQIKQIAKHFEDQP